MRFYRCDLSVADLWSALHSVNAANLKRNQIAALQIRINEDGFAHLSAFDMVTRQWSWLTTGRDFEVTDINGFHSGANGHTLDTVTITVTGSPASVGPEQRHLQTLEWPSSASNQDTPSATIATGFKGCEQNPSGYYSGSVTSPDGNWMLCNYQASQHNVAIDCNSEGVQTHHDLSAEIVEFPISTVELNVI